GWIHCFSRNAAIRFTKASVLLAYMFAPSDANKFRLLLFKIFRWISVLLCIALFFGLVFSIVENIEKLFLVLKALAIMCSMINYVAKVVIVRIYGKEFEKLQLTVTNFRKIIQKFVNKCWKFQLFVTFGTYMASTAFILGPLVQPQKFPTDAVYPFSTENFLVVIIVYLHQILVAYQCSPGVAVDSQMAIYLWYLCVRFEGLIIQMDYVENQHQLAQFIRNHQSLLLFTKKVIPPIRAVIFSSVAINNKFIMICAGVVLLSNGTSFEKVQCTIMISFIALNIYTFIWPADCLIDITSYGVSNKVLDMFRTWTLEMKKSCLLIIHRAQHPVVINIPGFLETLSHQYYSSFLSAAFSIFTALRAVLNS
ncbi:GSCOCT00013800001.3-RA-CDS, partial [Cotesia congregata]